jgi:endogenous inhibitor of DNA gyrase (YacG/DUF329 family)
MKHRCPICRKPTDSDTDADFPFCSERCRLIDLGQWASERYVVSEPIFGEEGEETSEEGSGDRKRDEPAPLETPEKGTHERGKNQPRPKPQRNRQN